MILILCLSVVAHLLVTLYIASTDIVFAGDGYMVVFIIEIFCDEIVSLMEVGIHCRWLWREWWTHLWILTRDRE